MFQTENADANDEPLPSLSFSRPRGRNGRGGLAARAPVVVPSPGGTPDLSDGNSDAEAEQSPFGARKASAQSAAHEAVAFQETGFGAAPGGSKRGSVARSVRASTACSDAIRFDFGENAEFVAPFSTFQLQDKINFAFEGIPENFASIEELASWMVVSSIVTKFSLFVVLVSCVNFAVDTLPSLWGKRHPVTFSVEASCIAWFTLELLVRFVTSREKRLFFLQPLNIVDTISILPFYVDVIATNIIGSSDFTNSSRALIMVMILRFTKLSRVLKLSKHSDGMRSIYETFMRSQAALSLMFFLLSICVIIGSTAVYFSEQTVQRFDPTLRRWVRSSDGTESPFQSIFHAIWFSIVTITTVGYGDDNVVSVLGKLSASAMMLVGVFVIAFPTVILSSNFHDIHNSRLAARDLVESKLERMAQHAAEDRRGSKAAGSDSSDDDGLDEEEHKRMMFLRRRKLTTRRVSYSYVEKELAAEALEYRVSDEPSVARGICINGYRAEYAPLLVFQREVQAAFDATSGAREEERPIMISVQPNFPIGVIVNFVLVLHTREAHEAAQRAVNESLGPAAPLLRVVPRPIKRLIVAWSSPHPMLSSVKVVTKVFRSPVGKVPVQLHLPYFDALPALLRYNAGASFHFEVDYEEPMAGAVAGVDMAVAARLHGAQDVDSVSSSHTSTPRMA